MCIRYNSSFDCMLFLLGFRILHILASFCFPQYLLFFFIFMLQRIQIHWIQKRALWVEG